MESVPAGFDKSLGYKQIIKDIEGHNPLEQRKREFEEFKNGLITSKFFDFVKSNGHLEVLKSKGSNQERFDYFIGLIEDFNSQIKMPNFAFGFYLMDRFQKEFPLPEYNVDMCKNYSMELGDDAYIKKCLQPGGLEVITTCMGFNFKRGNCMYKPINRDAL